MDLIKQQIADYIQIKEDIKKLTDDKKVLEAKICATMEENGVSTFELPNGQNLNYAAKDILSLTKNKPKTKT